jgi:phosphoesterase RecJ-like protein
MLSAPELQQVREHLMAATAVSVITHSSPDGDAIGSLLGLVSSLRKEYPQKFITAVCHSDIPGPFRFLEGSESVRREPEKESDLVIFLDCAEPKLTGFFETHPQLFVKDSRSINIDHHETNTHYGTMNIVIKEASSTAEILFSLLEGLQLPIAVETATCLLTGIYTDTGSLMHSNTTAAVCRALASLMRKGAAQQLMVQQVLRSSKLSTLRLWGRVLEKITITEEAGAVSAVTEEDFQATGAEFSELTNAIDYLNAIPGMRFSLILSEREGKVKGSLRTLRDDVDVAAMAKKLQGGGHRKAAGFSVPGKLTSEVRWKIVPN